jgi:ATP-dependent Clp protease ATP-binding subunit ClpA
MQTGTLSMASRPARKRLYPPLEIGAALRSRLFGQDAAIATILPYIRMHQAGLAEEGRPVAVFLLLGPSGTGKTKTVESLAAALHGSEKAIVKINCGEYQADHDVAKLIGAPPGYLGHRETVPMLTQEKLEAVTSMRSDLSLVLFDEVEKASPSLTQLLLGPLDKGLLNLSDGSSVSFERSLIFMTSNLGAREIGRALRPDYGFETIAQKKPKLGQMAINAAKKYFSPEFINRIDAMITYEPLSRQSLWSILNSQIGAVQHLIETRLQERSFLLEVNRDSRLYLLNKGTSPEFGARELKRTLKRDLTQVLGAMVAAGKIDPGARVQVDLRADKQGLAIVASGGEHV